MDLAASIQVVTEEVVLAIARRAQAITGERNLVLAGGVALNCVAIVGLTADYCAKASSSGSGCNPPQETLAGRSARLPWMAPDHG